MKGGNKMKIKNQKAKAKIYFFLSVALALVILLTSSVRAESLIERLVSLENKIENLQGNLQGQENINQMLLELLEIVEITKNQLDDVLKKDLAETEKKEFKEIKMSLIFIKTNLESKDYESAANITNIIIQKVKEQPQIGSVILPLIDTEKTTKTEQQTKFKKQKKNFLKKFLKKYGYWIGGALVLGIINQNQDRHPKPEPEENLPPVPGE